MGIVNCAAREIITIEVKSRDSNWADLRRGVYQCVQYRAVMEAQKKSRQSRGIELAQLGTGHPALQIWRVEQEREGSEKGSRRAVPVR